MSSTGVNSLDGAIDKANAWLADIDAGFGTDDRQLAYRVLRAWLHCLRDRLSVEVSAHFAAQLPELLRGVFFDGWNPSRVPQKYDWAEYVTRFAREARDPKLRTRWRGNITRFGGREVFEPVRQDADLREGCHLVLQHAYALFEGDH
jgi:uncharacterized protein (DUF2267 family)